MSVQGNYQGGVERSTDGLLLTTTNQTDVYEATDRDVIIAAFSVANEDSSARVVTVEYYDGSTDRTIWHKSVAADDTEIVSDIPQRLYSGDKIKATAAGANVITVNLVIIRSNSSEATISPV